MNYSGVILISCLLVFPALGDIMEQLQTAGMTCIKETGTDLGKLMLMMKGQEIAGDDKVKCFGACFMKSLGLMTSAGEVDKNAALAMIPQDMPKHDQVVAAITECLDHEGSNECETAYAIGECLRTKHLDALPMISWN